MKRAHWLEFAALMLLASLAAAAVPLTKGYFGWSWDALNHHVYLGMTAESPRWHLDVEAASVQTYQYPYLYWPVYRLSLISGSGAVVGAIWSAFQMACVLPPVWFLCLRLLPDAGSMWQGIAERALACTLAFMSIVVLAGLETTANDLLASVPMLWAVVIGLRASTSTRAAVAAAALWGVATAFKLSNGIYLPLLLLWWWVPLRPYLLLHRGVAMGAAATVGFMVAYAPWGWQLWRVTGNPLYPYFGQLFTRS